MKIVNRWSGETIWEGDVQTIQEAVSAAIAAGANLTDANLTGANLTGANLQPSRDDLWAVLSSTPSEVPALIAALREGRIDGSSYEGSCACLVGTLAHARGCEYDAIPGLSPNASRPVELFFAAIKPGDTPETSQFSRLAIEWCEDWLLRMQQAFGGSHA